MEQEFKKLISGLSRIKINQKERGFMLEKIYNTPIPSPFYRTSYFLYSTTSVFLLMVIFTGTLISSASALPGDSLYSIKVKVAEPIVGVSQISPEAKADWEEVKAVRRIDEAVTLSDQGKLTEKKAKILEDNFKKHADSFFVAKENIATTSEGKKDIKNKFKNKIKEKTKDSSKRDNQRENLKKFMKDVEDDIEDR